MDDNFLLLWVALDPVHAFDHTPQGWMCRGGWNARDPS